jgi:hypothetical protein
MTVLQPIAGTAAGLPAGLSMAGVKFANQRKISMATLARLGVVSGTEFFPELKRESEALRFVYPGGWKARLFLTRRSLPARGSSFRSGISMRF